MFLSALAIAPSRRAMFRLRRQSVAIVCAMLVACLAFSPVAEAKTKRHHHRQSEGGGGFTPTAASLVVDYYSGRVLYSSNADAQTYPASLTKVMTLYLLFERLQQGTVSLNSRIPISTHAANQAPSRLGLRPGQTIRVEDAILALVTKSANDIAVAMGEYLGGSEKDFARLMTAKAHALGMSRTQYMNASGLPNKGQLTTARDQATLAKRIQTDFPQYFRYFSTEQFAWDGALIRNHNHLLGKYEGVTGLKTGYTAASGFNLTTTIKRDNKSLIGVVLGGKTSRARDLQMVAILDRALPSAMAMRDTGTRLASAAPRPAAKPAGISDSDRVALASLASRDEPDPDEESYTGTDQVASLTAPAPAQQALVQSQHPVVTPVKPATAVQSAALGSPAPIKPATILNADPVLQRVASIEPAAPAVVPASRPAVVAAAAPAAPVATRRTASAPIDRATAYALAAIHKAEGPVRTASREIGNLIVTPAQASEGNQATQLVPAQKVDLAQNSTQPAVARTGHAWRVGDSLIPEGSWVIQIGAYADQADAVDRIRSAIKAAPELGKAVPVTLAVKTADNRMLYRSRFGGFDDEREARNACGRLARESISCIAIPPANWAMPKSAAKEKQRG